MSTQAIDWKVVYVAPRSEKKVGKRLTELGIENYVPIVRERRKWSDRLKWVELPMISGYVFVRPSSIQRDQVLQISSALQYVRYNKTDAIVRQEEISALISIQEKGYYVETVAKDVIVGDEVEIGYGPFKGLSGTVQNGNAETVFTVTINCLDLALKIKVPGEVLIKKNEK